MIPNKVKAWVVKEWKEKVFNKSSEVDPGDEELWRSIALGFTLGLGYRPEEAHELVRAIDKSRLL